MYSIAALLIAAHILSCASASPRGLIHTLKVDSSQEPVQIPPSQDPFYTAPEGFASAAPGTILRLRQAPGNLTTIFNASSAAYNILYRTTDSRYQASWAVTTLFVPLQLNSTGDALLSYQIPYNTADVDSSPSYDLYSGLSTGLVLSDISTALGYGWYVNVPDFEGPLAAFTSGVQEGHAVLDSVRAALSSGFGLTSDARYAMWGYSGGSLASEWAAELQVQYAPELNFSGVALGGLVPNVTSTMDAVDGTPAAGLVPAILLGATKQYPAASEYLINNLKTSGLYNVTGFLAADNMSIFQDFLKYANQSIFETYFINGSTILRAPIVRQILEINGLMGYHGVPQMPVFIYKAIQDEYSPVGDTDTIVARYCDVDANILYQRNTVGNHVDEETNGDARALQWLRSVLDKSTRLPDTSQGCVIQNVTVNITSHGPFLPPF